MSSTMLDLIFMTGNAHKIDEARHILGQTIQVKSSASLGFHEEVAEIGNTFHENAQIKLDAFKSKYPNMDCFSEDSGLVVRALNGEPGIHTARYAGEKATANQNMDKLLNKLDNENKRDAYFIAVICLYFQNKMHFFEGRLHGRISKKKIGDKGFGYDPIFIPTDEVQTLAELGNVWKSQNSHRSKAIIKMRDFLI